MDENGLRFGSADKSPPRPRRVTHIVVDENGWEVFDDERQEITLEHLARGGEAIHGCLCAFCKGRRRRAKRGNDGG